MTSTYSTNLKLELMGTGDQSGTWGDTTNTNLGTLIEQAVVGYTTQALTGAGPTAITIPNGATGVARNYILEFTGTPTAGHTVTVPASQKSYILFNNTNVSITVKVSGQTGVTIAVGKKALVYNNATDIIEVVNAPVGEATTQTLTNKTFGPTTFAGTVTATTITSPAATNLTIQSAGTTAMTIDTSQNVGIGTTTPSTRLTVVSATNAGIAVNDGTVNTIIFNTTGGSASIGTTTNHPVDFYSNNAARMRIDSSGNVGIGTSSPSGKLDVSDTNCIVVSRGTGGYGSFFAKGSGTNSSYLFMGNATNGEQARITVNDGGTIDFANTSSATNRMRIDASGNVGIGTSSPSYTLDVRATTGSISATSNTGTNFAKLQCNNSGGSYQFGIDNSAGTNFGSGTAYARVIWNDSSTAPTILYTNSTERMRISSGGSVGIGTTDYGTFNRGLSIYAAGGVYSGIQLTNSTTGNVSTAGTLIYTAGNDFIINNIQSGLIAFYTANTERMRIDSSGNVGIGATANASAILDAQSTTKGVRFPNMTTTQKNAISSPAAGLVVFDTTLAKLCVYSGSAWQTITSV